MEVNLFTSLGEFVVKLTMPPFSEDPEVIQWGDRTFVIASEHHTDSATGYREVFCWYAPATRETP